jgi:cell division protein FtsZ
MNPVNKKTYSSIIKVLGVGGGGSNAVNHMYKQGIVGVDFAVCNTDHQALDISPVPVKIQLGPDLTEGRGAGSKPQVGKEACVESIEELKEFIKDAKMLFITAGMGGGTGTGAAPVLAKAAQELDILTVAIVTIPFTFEGKRRIEQAMEGLEELKKNVDTIVVISNDKLRHIYGNLSMSQAFANADDVLTVAAKGIAEIITIPGYVNVDFEDVNTVMRGSGVAVMGTASMEGPDRAKRAIESALNSPLLEDNDITGAKHILLNITSGKQEVTMDEVNVITEYLETAAGDGTDIIWGNCYDDTLGDKLSVTVIATGFETGRKQRLVESKSKAPQHNEPVYRQEQQQNYNQDREVPPVRTLREEPPVRKVSLDDEVNTAPKKNTNSPYDFNNKAQVNQPLTFEFETPLSSAKETVKHFHDKGEPYIQEEEDQQPQRQVVNTNRKTTLRDLSTTLNNPSTVNELENEPAYLRKQVRLDDVPHSSDSNLSRWTVSNDEDEPEFNENNSFLHDNVD